MPHNGKLGRGRNEGVFRRVAACGLACVSCRKYLLDEYQQADEIFSCWPSTILQCSDNRGLMLF